MYLAHQVLVCAVSELCWRIRSVLRRLVSPGQLSSLFDYPIRRVLEANENNAKLRERVRFSHLQQLMDPSNSIRGELPIFFH